jgi:hypothetical protein
MKARTMTRTPKYVTSFSPGLTQVFQMPLAGLSTRPVFGDWDHESDGRLIAEFTRMPLVVVAPGDGRVMTWLESLEAPKFGPSDLSVGA